MINFKGGLFIFRNFPKNKISKFTADDSSLLSFILSMHFLYHSHGFLRVANDNVGTRYRSVASARIAAVSDGVRWKRVWAVENAAFFEIGYEAEFPVKRHTLIRVRAPPCGPFGRLHSQSDPLRKLRFLRCIFLSTTIGISFQSVTFSSFHYLVTNVKN